MAAGVRLQIAGYRLQDTGYRSQVEGPQAEIPHYCGTIVQHSAGLQVASWRSQVFNHLTGNLSKTSKSDPIAGKAIGSHR